MGGGGISPLIFRIECRFFRFRFLYFTSDGGSSVVTYCYLFSGFSLSRGTKLRRLWRCFQHCQPENGLQNKIRTFVHDVKPLRAPAKVCFGGSCARSNARGYHFRRQVPHLDRFALQPPLKGEVIGLSSTDRSSTPLRRDGSGWREGCCSRVPALRRRQCRRSRARCAGSGLRGWV